MRRKLYISAKADINYLSEFGIFYDELSKQELKSQFYQIITNLTNKFTSITAYNILKIHIFFIHFELSVNNNVTLNLTTLS